MEPLLARTEAAGYNAADWNQMFDLAYKESNVPAAPVHRVHFLKRDWIRYAAAAVILFVIAGTYFLLQPKKQELLSQARRFKNDVAPARTGAILTIEGGKTILLDTAVNGTILGHFVKEDSGLTVESAKAQYAILYTPAAHTEMLRLKDGTIVYLNASSSIRFPTIFNGKERLVEITGEVYFEVVHNAAMPFRVKLPDGSIVEDVGTAFNINAYNDEAGVTTTVAEGIVNVIHQAQRLTLNAGQQAKEEGNGKLLLNNHPNMEETMAWKNGMFSYTGADIKTIMRHVSRWYGVEVVYEDVTDEEFVADLPRDVPVSKLLNALEGTGKVHFTIDGKKIIVSK